MLRVGTSIDWNDKIALAMHTGNVGSRFRRHLADVASEHPNHILVNEVFIGDKRKDKTCKQLNLHKTGGYVKHKCFMKFEDQCQYKYLINSASIGYANKFKYLFLCQSLVLYIEEGMSHHEFYEYGLLPGVHYISVPSAKELPSTIEQLKKNDDYAKQIARNGMLRMASLDKTNVVKFVSIMLNEYAARQTFKVTRDPGAIEIKCEDDLWRHYGRDQHFISHFTTQNNRTCIGGVGKIQAPGWGGSYIGSKVRCVASHDLRTPAQPEACKAPYRGRVLHNSTNFRTMDSIIIYAVDSHQSLAGRDRPRSVLCGARSEIPCVYESARASSAYLVCVRCTAKFRCATYKTCTFCHRVLNSGGLSREGAFGHSVPRA